MASELLDLDDVAFIDEATDDDFEGIENTKPDPLPASSNLSELLENSLVTRAPNPSMSGSKENLISEHQEVSDKADFRPSEDQASTDLENLLDALRKDRSKHKELPFESSETLQEIVGKMETTSKDINSDKKRSLENLNDEQKFTTVSSTDRVDDKKELDNDNEREQKLFKSDQIDSKINGSLNKQGQMRIAENENNTAVHDQFPNLHKVKPLALRLSCNKVHTGHTKTDTFNGAKPKQYITPRNTESDKDADKVDDPYFKFPSRDLSLGENNEVGSFQKDKKSKRRSKTKGKHLTTVPSIESPQATIVITSEDGVQHELKSNKHGSYSEKHTFSRPTSRHSDQQAPSVSADTPGSQVSSADVTTETVSDEGETVNNLLLQQELYKQRKTKPFQKMTKIKTGLFEVGIECDTKRSIVKSMVLLENKNIILFDRNNKCLKLFDCDFNPLDKMTIGVKFCSLTPIHVNSVVATLPKTKHLQIFHVNTNTCKILRQQTLPVHEELYSVTHFNSKLFMLQRVRKAHFTDLDEWQIKRMDLDTGDESLKLLRTICPGHKDCSLFANDQGLYMTNKVENEILLMKPDGAIINRTKVRFHLSVFPLCL